jgi:hypothetical protein
MLVRGLCLLTLLAHSDAQERRDPDAAARGRGTAPARTPDQMPTGPDRQDLRAVGRHQDVPPPGPSALVHSAPKPSLSRHLPPPTAPAAPCQRRWSAAPTRAGVAEPTPRRAAAHTASTLPINRHGGELLGGYSTSINRTHDLRRVAARHPHRKQIGVGVRRSTRVKRHAELLHQGPGCRSDALEEWHRYSLPSFKERMKTRLRNHCQEDHHSCPAKGRYTRHTAEAARHRRLSIYDADAHAGGSLHRQTASPRLGLVDLDTGEINDF